MEITKQDIDLLKQGLFDLNSEQNQEKMREIKKRMDAQYRRLGIKSGARFSQDSKSALDEHVSHLRSVAKKARSMAGELKMHANMLDAHADDLSELYQNEGQGPAFATD